MLKGLLKLGAALALLAVLSVAALFLLLSHEHSTPLTLPAPAGHFPVGRATFFWTNPAVTDELSPVPGAKRSVMVWMWYPAAPSSAPPVEYLPASWREADAQHSGILLSKFLSHDLAKVRTHSAPDPPVSPAHSTYPVVILRAGGGAPTADFTTLAEDLASHGYFVVGFDAPYRTITFTFPDGHTVERSPASNPEGLGLDQANRVINRLLPMWTSDTKFVVDQLARLNAANPSGPFSGRLDLQHLGMFGHSFGGATSLQFCHDDSRCQAAIDMDGAPYGSVVQDGLHQPTLILLSDHSRELASDPAAREIAANLHSIYDRLPADRRLFVVIAGANHFSFSDQILLKSQYVVHALQAAGPFGHLDPQRGLALTAAYVHTFFDVYLQSAPASQLSNLPTQFPEAHPEQP